jgi:small subunit ribosomal protein S9
MAKETAIWAVGRRKTSVARAKIKNGTGKVTVNQKDIKDYIAGGAGKVAQALRPLEIIQGKDRFDIMINVTGGGIAGQVGAISHAISRALCKIEAGLRPTLKKAGTLTRDSRMVERKKYGKHKARRGTQFSKR